MGYLVYTHIAELTVCIPQFRLG